MKGKNLDPIDRADIVREQIRILDNTEGVTQDVIDRANALLLEVEEEEANYLTHADWVLDQEARSQAEMTDKDIQDMADHYEDVKIDNARDTL